MELLDSRRLTGPNLLWDRPSAVIDVRFGFRFARDADTTLVLIFGDNVKRCWKQIIYFDAKAQKQKPQEIKKTRMVPAEEPGFAMDADVTLISDERGVRIAREPEAED